MSKSMMSAALAVGVSAVLAGAAGATIGSGPTDGQPRDQSQGQVQPRQIISTIRPLREALIDLVEEARERRPGQVMKGDPSPYGTAPKPVAEAPAAAPTAAAGAEATMAPKPALMLPDTAPESKPKVKPTMDAGASGSASAAAVERLKTEATPAGAGAKSASASSPAPMSSGLAPGAVMMEMAAPVGTGPAKVRVESISGDASSVQWRSGGGAWATPSIGETIEGNVEVRAGLDGRVVLVVDNQARVGVSRLGRVTIERSAESGGGAAVSVALTRGAADVTPVSETSQMFARIHTPDADFGLAGPVRVEYDAFTGTHRKVVNP